MRAFIEAHPARYGVMKGELKSGLKAALDAALFDPALTHRGRRDAVPAGRTVRPADLPWSPPAATMALLEGVERELEAAGLAGPSRPCGQAKLGAAASEVVSLGFFLGRLVRVSQEFTYTTRQLEALRAKLATFFARQPAMTMADFKELSGTSRKFSVPLLEHSDRVGWTVRVGDERKAGGKLAGGEARTGGAA